MQLGNRRKADPEFAAVSSPMPYCHEMLQRYGPLVSFSFGPLPALLAVDPATIRAIYISHNMEFEKPWMMRKLFPLLGDGLLTSNKETWASHRRLVNPAFKPGEIMVSETTTTHVRKKELESNKPLEVHEPSHDVFQGRVTNLAPKLAANVHVRPIPCSAYIRLFCGAPLRQL